MYYPQEPKEPNGCIQTLTITRLILGMLLVPMGLILGAILALLLAFYALTVNPLLALLVVAIGGGIVYAAGRWEHHRIKRDYPRDE